MEVQPDNGKAASPSTERITFRCELCGMSEKCDYRGRKPPFANKIELLEESYIMKDPFAPPPLAVPDRSSAEHYLVLGADCSMCRRAVCKGLECSFFYSGTFCKRCSMDVIKQFPIEIQSKIKRQFKS